MLPWHIFVEHQISIIFMEVIPKQFATVPMTSPVEVSLVIFIYKLLWR